MTAHDSNPIEDRIRKLLQHSLPAVPPDAEPRRDLWPALLRRLDAEPPPAKFAVPWFDWALIAGLVVFALSFPATIPLALYYL